VKWGLLGPARFGRAFFLSPEIPKVLVSQAFPVFFGCPKKGWTTSRVVLTPRRWRQVRGGLVGPTGRRQTISADDGGKRARSPRRARRKPLKPLRAGMPGDSGVLVVTRVRSTNTKCTRDRGCIRHPAFPTPLFGARDKCKPRAHRAARMRMCVHQTIASFPDVQLHIVDAPLGAGPESILPAVVMDSGLARSLSSGGAERRPVGAPRNDGLAV
jgi:hypothetical protein